nr:uncharacterized protein LOC132763820 [Anolis sagrei ordinatus]
MCSKFSTIPWLFEFRMLLIGRGTIHPSNSWLLGPGFLLDGRKRETTPFLTRKYTQWLTPGSTTVHVNKILELDLSPECPPGYQGRYGGPLYSCANPRDSLSSFLREMDTSATQVSVRNINTIITIRRRVSQSYTATSPTPSIPSVAQRPPPLPEVTLLALVPAKKRKAEEMELELQQDERTGKRRPAAPLALPVRKCLCKRKYCNPAPLPATSTVFLPKPFPGLDILRRVSSGPSHTPDITGEEANF